jgi:hypothetical protein
MTDDPRPAIYPDPERAPLEVVVRVVCGVLLGVALGLAMWLRAQWGLAPGLVATAASMAVCAWGSLRWGDEFWMAVLRRGR